MNLLKGKNFNRVNKPLLCIWITGMPASGKSTLAGVLCEKLSRIYPVVHLESDVWREKIRPENPYSDEGKKLFYRRLLEKAVQFGNAGKIPIIDATAQRRSFREQAKWEFQSVFEVYVYSPALVRAIRDPKGLYHKCAKGEVLNLPIYPVGDVKKPQFISHEEDRDCIRRLFPESGVYEVPEAPSYICFGLNGDLQDSAKSIVEQVSNSFEEIISRRTHISAQSSP